METETKSALLIFKVISDCYLSEVKLVLEHDEPVFLPKIKVNQGDFVWITNMEREEVDQIISNNSSKTKTLILQVVNEKFNLLDFKYLEKM